MPPHFLQVASVGGWEASRGEPDFRPSAFPLSRAGDRIILRPGAPSVPRLLVAGGGTAGSWGKTPLPGPGLASRAPASGVYSPIHPPTSSAPSSPAHGRRRRSATACPAISQVTITTKHLKCQRLWWAALRHSWRQSANDRSAF